jgi:hypothetical protein
MTDVLLKILPLRYIFCFIYTFCFPQKVLHINTDRKNIIICLLSVFLSLSVFHLSELAGMMGASAPLE